MTTIVFYKQDRIKDSDKCDFDKPMGEIASGWVYFFHEGYNPENVNDVNLPLPLVPSDKDKTIIFIPFKVKQEMISFIRDKFRFKTRDSQVDIPTSKELGLVNGSSRADFYDDLTSNKDDLEIKEVITKEDITMDIAKIQTLIDNICKENNGVSGIAIINRSKGKTLLYSKVAGADGDFTDLLSNLNWITPVITLKQSLEKGTGTVLVDKMKCFQNTVLHFEGGAIISDFEDTQLPFKMMIAYLNLNPELVGIAETTAEMITPQIIKLFSE